MHSRQDQICNVGASASLTSSSLPCMKKAIAIPIVARYHKPTTMPKHMQTGDRRFEDGASTRQLRC